MVQPDITFGILTPALICSIFDEIVHLKIEVS